MFPAVQVQAPSQSEHYRINASIHMKGMAQSATGDKPYTRSTQETSNSSKSKASKVCELSHSEPNHFKAWVRYLRGEAIVRMVRLLPSRCSGSSQMTTCMPSSFNVALATLQSARPYSNT